jgi:D-inositol-3-phosphate glycosyltransferase
MKIIIIGPAHPYRGGIALGNELVARDFQQKGHQVELVTFSMQYPSFLFPGKTQFSDNPAPKDLTIHRKINSVNPLNWIRVGKWLCHEKPDLIIVRYWLPFMGPSLGTLLRYAKRNGHTKIIALFDNVIPHESRMGDKLLTRYFLKPVDGFMTMADAVSNDLDEFDSAKPRTQHPHPIFDNYGSTIPKKDALNRLHLDSDKFTLLFFGLIRDYKGLDILLDALAQSRHKSTIQLLVAGEFYANEEAVRSQIRQLGLEDLVHIENRFIPDSEVHLYFSAADVLVLPYRSATQSGVTQIAYHFDLPMIVTKVGALPEMVPHEKIGLHIEPNADACAHAINRFIEEDLSLKFKIYFEEEKKKFTWSSFNDGMLSLYNTLNK